MQIIWSQLIMNNLKFICGFLIAILVDAVVGNNSLYVINHPSYVNFQPTKQSLSIDHTSSLVSTLLGLSVSNWLSWDGITAGNPFHRPEAVVMIVVDDASGRKVFSESKYLKYNVNLGLDGRYSPISLEGTYNELRSLYENDGDIAEQPNIVNANTDKDWLGLLGDTDIDITAAGDVSYKFLDMKSVVDRQLLTRILALGALHEKLVKEGRLVRDGVGDIYKLDLASSLNQFSNEYSQTDTGKLHRAMKLLKEAIDKLCGGLREVYKEDYVVMVLSVDGGKMSAPDEDTLYRVKRQTDPDGDNKKVAGEQDDGSDWNLSASYDANYAVIFNIILWTSIVLALALYAVSASMWDMDPGRESIIYRMTSTRIKKD